MKNKKLLLVLVLLVLILAPGAKGQQILTLNKAFELAETGSPDLQQSLLNLERYRKSLEAQRAALKSRFSLEVAPVNYDRSRRFDNRFSDWYTSETFQTSALFRVVQPILPTDGSISLTNEFGWQSSSSSFSDNQTGGLEQDNEIFFNRLFLNFNQPLFTYNRLKLELQELELNFENANIAYALQRLNLERNVTQYFYNVYMAQMNLNIAEDELENTQNSYDIIKNKVEAGLSAKEELYQAELNLATSKSSVQDRQVALENAKDQLKLYLGMDLFENFTVMADVAVNPVPIDLERAIDNGLELRMELRQREIDVEASTFDLIRVRSQNEFRGDVNLRLGITGDDPRLNQIFDAPTSSPSVGVSFNIPLWDWGEKEARIAAQEAAIASQKLNLSEEKRQIVVDIRQTYRNLQNQLTQMDIAQQNVNNAQLTYEINLERYENGDLTGMDLNLYQNQLSEKKIAYAQALINYKIELLNLKIQSLYDFIQDKPIVPSELYLEAEIEKTRK